MHALLYLKEAAAPIIEWLISKEAVRLISSEAFKQVSKIRNGKVYDTLINSGHKIDIISKDLYGTTLFHEALQTSNFDIISFLIEQHYKFQNTSQSFYNILKEKDRQGTGFGNFIICADKKNISRLIKNFPELSDPECFGNTY